jgi:hypothetical protein
VFFLGVGILLELALKPLPAFDPVLCPNWPGISYPKAKVFACYDGNLDDLENAN